MVIIRINNENVLFSMNQKPTKGGLPLHRAEKGQRAGVSICGRRERKAHRDAVKNTVASNDR